MGTVGKIEVPNGYVAVENPDGSITVRKGEDMVLSKSITFRTVTAEFNRLLPFVETFPERSWSHAFRWLLDQDEVRDVITSRVRAALHEAP